MKSKRILALLLAGILLSASFVSCSSDDEEQSDPADGTETVGEDAAPEENADDIDFSSMSFVERVRYANANMKDGLPEKKYGGKDVNILAFSFPEGLNGDVVNDARYQQGLNVMERYDVKVNPVSQLGDGSYDGYVAQTLQAILAGDASYDIMVNWNTSTAGLMLEGCFADVSQFNSIDTTKPWFFGEEMKLYGYKGHQYIITGMMNVADVTGTTECTFFNKSIAKAYNVEDLYQVVRDGKWTIDYANNLIKDFYYDIDGDGAESEADIYGLYYARAESWMCTLASLGIPQASLDKDGNPYLTIYQEAEKSERIMDSIKAMLSTKGAFTYDDWGIQGFQTGNALLHFNRLEKIGLLRDTDVDYGILPRFKENEAQENYYSSYLPNPWTIPITASDKEMSANVLAAIAVEGFREVLPSYYETVMKNKFSTDEESGEMIEIMMSNVRADAEFVYGTSGYMYLLYDYFPSELGYASFFEERRSQMETTMSEALAKYEELVNRK